MQVCIYLKFLYSLKPKNGQNEVAIQDWAAGISSGLIMGAVTFRDELY